MPLVIHNSIAWSFKPTFWALPTSYIKITSVQKVVSYWERRTWFKINCWVTLKIEVMQTRGGQKQTFSWALLKKHLYLNSNIISSLHFSFEIVVAQSTIIPSELNQNFCRKHHSHFIEVVNVNHWNVDANLDRWIFTGNWRVLRPIDIIRKMYLKQY